MSNCVTNSNKLKRSNSKVAKHLSLVKREASINEAFYQKNK